MADWSPDGRFVAYVSDENGGRQVFVQTYPDATAGKWPVSKMGSGYPRWSSDGRELFYIDPDDFLVASPITVKGSQLEIGAPARLFEMRTGFRGSAGYPYDVGRDGRHFVVTRQRTLSRAPGLTVVVNWSAARP